MIWRSNRFLKKKSGLVLFRAESSDWQGAHPDRGPTGRCGDVSLPFGARGLGLAVRGQGGVSHWAGWEAGGLESSQRCLKKQKTDEKMRKKKKINKLSMSLLNPHVKRVYWFYLRSDLCQMEGPRMLVELWLVLVCNEWAGGAAGQDLAVHALPLDWTTRTDI